MQINDIYTGDHIGRGDHKAPAAVSAALIAGAGTRTPDASFVAYKDDGGKTTWAVTWLVGAQLVHVEATKSKTAWTSISDHRNSLDADVVGWVRPVRSLIEIGIAGQRISHAGVGDHVNVYPKWQLRFAGDAQSWTVFDHLSDSDLDEAREFVSKVREVWFDEKLQ